jgi:glycosyltransferase involved in cell wall biosynthesis
MNQSIATQPLVSVILPVFNGGQFLLPAIVSIINQTYQNWELIIIDDGSTDNALDQIKQLKEPRIRLISDGVNKGLAKRLNEAVAFAKGIYIARMDADDISFPLRLASQVNFLEKHTTIDLVGCRAVAFKENGVVIGLLPFAADHDALCAHPWRNIPLPHPTWMARKDWFKEHSYRIPEVVRAEDQELLLRSCVSSKFYCLDQVLLGYRQGPFNLRRTFLARRTLLKAQLKLFLKRREWRNICLALGVTAIKIVIDFLASLPGLELLFFKRMNYSVPAGVKKQLQTALAVSRSNYE